jgi:hypothetical protein
MRRNILRTATCCAVLLVATTRSGQTSGGFCEAYKTKHADGSSTWCSVKPGRGRACPLGLGFSMWICRNGIWVAAPSKGAPRR